MAAVLHRISNISSLQIALIYTCIGIDVSSYPQLIGVDLDSFATFGLAAFDEFGMLSATHHPALGH